MSDIYPILSLHREAFADKFGAAFGAKGAARGVEAMAEAWRRQGVAALRGMLVAEVDGQVVGTITLRTWEMGGDNTGAAEMAFHQVLGAWGALRSIFALSLLDHQIDRFEVENFNRQAGARLSTIGRPKVDVMAEMACEINPDVRIAKFAQGVTPQNIDAFLSGCDIYVDGLDFFAFDASFRGGVFVG